MLYFLQLQRNSRNFNYNLNEKNFFLPNDPRNLLPKQPIINAFQKGFAPNQNQVPQQPFVQNQPFSFQQFGPLPVNTAQKKTSLIEPKPSLIQSPEANPKKLSLTSNKHPQMSETANLNINILDMLKEEQEDYEVPNEEVQNQITFHLNSLCANNIGDKASELRKILEQEGSTQKWFAKTLVSRRVVQETLTKHNYLQLLSLLQLTPLNKLILKETYHCIHKLLSIQVNSSDKSSTQIKNFLKNLGYWLGHLTLARNKPIIQKHLNLKQLLLEGCNNNRLTIILPFICKVLEGSKSSEVFMLPNPWLRANLLLLNELLQKEDLKVALKQEIKLLFNVLNLESSQLAITSPKTSVSLDKNELDFVKIPPILKAKYQQVNLTEIVTKVIEKALSEVSVPVISRTVTIAMITGKKLIFKDFAFEASDNKMQNASLLIIQNLAYSLALAWAKEPLQASIHSSFNKDITGLNLSEKEFEEISQGVIQENIDKACELIQKRVLEKALSDISQDLELKEALDSRREGIYQTDENFVKEAEKLPGSLRPENYGLKPEEFAIYEDFSISNRSNNNIENKETNNEKNAFFFYNTLPFSLESHIDELNDTEMTSIVMNYKDFLLKVQYSEQQILGLSSKFLELYLKKGKKLDFLIKLEVLLMKSINNQAFVKKYLKEIKNFILNIPDYVLSDARFNETFLLNLYNSELLSAKKLDKICASLLKKPLIVVQNTVVKTLSHLICITKQLNPNNILLSWVALGNLTSYNENVVKFLDSLNKFSNFSLKLNKKNEILEFLEKKTQLHEKINAIFSSYLIVFFKGDVNNNSCLIEIEKILLNEGEETTIKCLAVIIEFIINHSFNSLQKVANIGLLDIDFTVIDAFVLLYTKLFNQINEKNTFFECLLDSLEAVLFKIHKKETTFNQRIFLRLINGIFENLKDFLQDERNTEFLCIILKKFLDLNPSKLPGFVVCWVELISHNLIIPLILRKEELQYYYHLILCELMKFFRKLLLANEESKKSENFKRLYLASIKIMLALLHDYPEFLTLYSFNLCNEIPDNFLQLKNIILAAFPKNMRLIDPFQINDVSFFKNNIY